MLFLHKRCEQLITSQCWHFGIFKFQETNNVIFVNIMVNNIIYTCGLENSYMSHYSFTYLNLNALTVY